MEKSFRNSWNFSQALGHDWEESEVTPATCTEKGEKKYTCKRCQKTKTEEIPATGHTKVIDEAVAPTCEKPGKTEGSHCSGCGEVYQKQEEIPATGHSWDEGKITKYPTATEAGERTYTCKSCGSTRTEAIDKDNSVRASGYNGSISWILYKDGKLVFKGDGAILNQSDTLEPWNSYKNYIFEVSVEDGITEIGESAFSGWNNIEKVTISTNVTDIGSNAFYSCISLEEISLPEGLKSISSQAFRNCSNLIEVIFPESLTKIGERTFAECSKLKKAELPEGISEIQEGTFDGCRNLKRVMLPDNVKYIRRQAFYGCENLVELTLPKDLKELGAETFGDCKKITSITNSGRCYNSSRISV